MTAQNTQPDFIFNLAIPVYKPSAQDIEFLSDPQHVEPFLYSLLESGHLSREELGAFVRFALQVSGVTPFLLDEFLKAYRAHAEESSILTPKGPKIIVPA